MSRVNRFVSVVAVLAAGVFGASSTARAQRSEGSPWSIDFAIGWDNDISGNINSSGIGTINNQAVVILKNSYEDVYGTGLHLRGGVGYMLGEQDHRAARVVDASSRSTPTSSRRLATSGYRNSTDSIRTTRR